MLDESPSVHRTDLIQNDESFFPLKAARNAERIGMTACRHRSNDDSAEMMVQLIGRDDEAGASLLDLANDLRVQ
jgi:hypothetical protein